MKYERILFIIFIVVFVAFSILSPDRFLRPFNLQTMLFQLPEFAILSLGMMICIVTGGINLSISSTTALTGIVGALILSGSLAGTIGTLPAIIIAIVVALTVAGLTGVFNGYFVAVLGVTPILVTIGTRAVFTGVGLVLTKGGSVSGFPEAFNFVGGAAPLGVPFPLLLFVVIAVLMHIFLHMTPWGERVFMVGSNPVAAEFSGIPVRRLLFQVYFVSSLLAGIAAVIMISRYNSGKVTLGSSYLLQTVAATVLGGTSIYGGKGRVTGVILATAILQVVSTGMNILGINRFLITVTMGTILIVALTINFFAGSEGGGLSFLRRRRSKEEAA